MLATVRTESFAASYLARLKDVIDCLDTDQVDDAIALISEAWLAGRQIITLGNGGSAMTALHFATDWNKAVYLATKRPFRGRSLLDNMGLVTAYANDTSYQDVFAEQLRNIAVQGDLVIAISGSGNSENVLRAIRVANDMGCTTLGLVGFSGGKLKGLAQHVVWANVNDMQLCEDIHAIFGHIVMQRLCAH